MYREIEGYENALSCSYDVIDETEELVHMISYGENSSDIIEQIERIERLTSKIKENVSIRI
jgi:hypothetical protein